jgi:hypothetical protein
MTLVIVGPRVIFDKSFIQSLSGALIDELTLYFTPTCVPTLISEIIADLKKPPGTDGRIGEDLVRQLARKMTGAHGAEPPPLRSLVIGGLHGRTPPMDGLRFPVMAGTRGVYSNEGGSQLIVSQIPQQEMWNRLAAGNFCTDDEVAAKAWRAAIDATNLEVARKEWEPFANRLGSPTTLRGVVEGVDHFMKDRDAAVQLKLVQLALQIVRATPREQMSAIAWFSRQGPGARLPEYAPFAAHVVRLYLSFVVGMACGLVGTRRTNTIDLQYLFYAPFCRVFISNDNLHRDLWNAGAVTSEASFVWGEDFRVDLRRRNEKRAAMTFEEWSEHRRVHGDWPEEIEGSIISALWQRHCPAWPRGGQVSPNVGKTIDELDDPHLRNLLKRAISMRQHQR